MKNLTHSLNFIGINANGVKSKWGTFKKLIREAKPSVWSMQETKCNVKGQFKLDDYFVYELIREDKAGGGLAIGALKDLNPAWIKEGNDDVEAITIEINVKKLPISFTVGYGPQENDKIERKDSFWDYLDEEVIRVKQEGKGFILQCDSNAWLGPKIIPGDPRPQNKNGKLFENFLNRHPQLTLINSLPICEGKITRSRMKDGVLEEAILDVYVVCQLVLPFVTKMIVDVDKKYILTNYHNFKKSGKAIDTDHVPVILQVNLMFSSEKPERTEIFNFNDEKGLQKFHKFTSQTSEFTNCFNNKDPLEVQINNWSKVLKTCCKNSFSKIRIKNKNIKKSAADVFINKRNKLDKIIKKDGSELNLNLRNDLENKISEILQQEGRTTAHKFLKHCNKFSSVDTQEMWKLKKKLWPKKKHNAPSAKYNHKGKLVTDPKQLKRTLAKEYKDRLRHRPVRQDFVKMKFLRNKLIKIKLQHARRRKSKKWTMEDLDKVLKSLKKGKSRGPEGFSNELFKMPVIGIDLKKSLLIMVNKIKENIFIPPMMKIANVTTIPKKGSKLLLKNERGIFRLSVVRSILMKLIYNQNYEKIDQNMSESNIGGRKGRGCRDHIFVINGIIHHQLTKKVKKPLCIQIYDYTQMFDSMSLKESMNDLYDVGVQDDSLALLYEANKDIKMSIKTPSGELTEEQTIDSVVLQGDTWGPALASNQVDTIGKECLEENKHLFMYKNIVPVGPLGMVDDLLGISEAGHKAKELNTYINLKTADKKLQFGLDKCKVMLVGKKIENFQKNKLFVDCWDLKYDEEENLIENFEGKKEMKMCDFEPYLGFVISSNGTNMKNIEKRKNISIGTIKQIMRILKGLGKFTFECAFIYMNSILRGSTLYACETYYNLSEKETRAIEKIDEDFMRKVFETQKSCPLYLLYLEGGQIPARFIIQKQKLNFLHHILQQRKNSLLYKFFKAQEKFPVKGDWVKDIKSIIKSLNLKFSFETIKKMKKRKFKNIIKHAIDKKAMKYLKAKQKKCSKGKEIIYSNKPEIQDYLLPNDKTTIEMQRNLFKFRTRMNDLPSNFPSSSSDLKCEKPCNEKLTNEHLYECQILNENEPNRLNYRKIFNGTTDNKNEVLSVINDKYEKWKNKKEKLIKIDIKRKKKKKISK